MAVQRAAASAMTAASRECLFGSWDALRAVSTNAGGRRGKERAARYERSSDWGRGAASSPDPDALYYTNLNNGTLLLREVEVERNAGLDGAKEGLDLRRRGRG